MLFWWRCWSLFLIARPALRKLKSDKAKDSANLAGGVNENVDQAAQANDLLRLADQGELDAGNGRITPEMIKAAPTPQMRNELLRHYVKQDKSRAALVVRELIKDKQNA